MLAFFATVAEAGRAVAGIAVAGLQPVTLELMDRVTIAAVDDWQHLGLDREAAALLMVESDLAGDAGHRELARAEEVCRISGATGTVRAADPQEADWLRNARRLAYRALERLGTARMEDIGAPRARVPELIAAIERIGERHGVLIGTFGHAGDGNLHPSIVLDRDDPAAEARTKAVCADLYQAALDLGGTVTGEHGIGASRREWLEPQRGRRAVEVMRAIKAAMDPLGTLNPGRVL
jgi:glycolate oxidase